MVIRKLFGGKCVRCGDTRTKTEYEGLPTCDGCRLKIEAKRESTMKCPGCSTLMNKLVVLNVIVDKCPACGGAWLDSGELALIEEAANSGEEAFATGLAVGIASG